MKLIEKVLKHRTWSVAFWMLVTAIGIISYLTMPVDLFPDTVPPQIISMTVVRGASAEDVNRKVTALIDRELQGLTGIKKVIATSRDEVSSVNAQFEYGTDISGAMTDVINAVNRVTGKFPAGAQTPQYFRVTDANRPIMTLAISPAASSSYDLKAIRLLADNDLKEEFLRLPGIGKVDVFGANEPEVLIRFDLDKLRTYSLKPVDILKTVGAQNLSLPGGYFENAGRESLVKTLCEATTPKELANMPIAVRSGGVVKLSDVAQVNLTNKTPRSLYHGNGEAAIALNFLKPENGFAVQGIYNGKKLVKQLQQRFPELKFAITTDQEPIINVNVAGMKGALFSAVWMTMLIVLIFLVEIRTSLIIGISIPLSFLTAFAFLFFTPFTINMVTLSGLIIAVGMVVDAAIVVVENVFRHMSEGESSLETIAKGTEEVVFSISGGMLTTIVVMIPIMFVGGYPQQVLRPLTMTISSTLIGSFLAAITIVPILLLSLFVHPDKDKSPEKKTNGLLFKLSNSVEFILNFVAEIYLSLLRIGLKVRIPLILFCFVLLVITARTVIPTIGRELMPRMDTGQIIIKADLPSSMPFEKVEATIAKVEKIIKSNEHVISISTVAGSEPGQVSFGAGGQLLQQFETQVRLTTREKRSETIWDINRAWREEMAKIPELVAFSVTEFGATPLSTTRAPIDVMISGRNPKVLYQLAETVDAKLRRIKGLNDLRFSWSADKPETHFLPKFEFINRYNLSPAFIGEFLGLTFSGRIPSFLKLDGFVDIPIRAEIGFDGQRWNKPIKNLVLPDSKSDIFLGTLGETIPALKPTLVTRESLSETIDILGINSILPLSTVAEDVQNEIKKINMPAGYKIELSGTMADMQETGMRLAKALLIGIILLYIVLFLLFECWWRPFLVMAAIPLSLIGALWGLVILDKPMCMPAMMGIILLGGTIVNNAIILIDFIDNAIAEGLSRHEALEKSVKIRLRPILITTFSTVIGLLPLTFEQAVGLERMSPLGVVASFGLLAGTLMTMVIIPIAYDLISDLKLKFSGKAVPVALAILLALPGVVHASEQCPNISECIETAFEKSPLLAIEKEKVKQAQANVSQQRSLQSPNVKLGISAKKWDQNRFGVLGVAPGGTQFYDDFLTDSQLVVRQLIHDAGKSASLLKAARYEQSSQEKKQERFRQELAFSVMAAYIEIITRQSSLEAVNKNLEDVSLAKEKVEKLFEVGRAAKLQVLKVEVRQQEILVQLEQVRHDIKAGMAKLARLCGMNSLPESICSRVEFSNSLSEELSDDELIKEALEERSDLMAVSDQVEIATFNFKAAKSQDRPSLNLVVAANRYGDKSGWGNGTGFAGLELSWTLFDGGLNRGKQMQARAGLKTAKYSLKEAELRVAENVRVARSTVISAKAKSERSKAAILLANEAYRAELLNFEAGKGTITDLLDSQSSLFNARAQLISDENSLLIARLALDLAIGKKNFW